mgnify:CR=1 FL=1
MNEYMNEYMKETNEALLHTYNQFPVVLDHGEGAYLYDTEGKKRIWILQPDMRCLRWDTAIRS